MTTSRQTPSLPHLRQNGILSPYRAAGRLKPATLSKRKKQPEPYPPFLRPYSANSRILPHRRNLRHHRRSIACRRRIRLAVCRVARRREQHQHRRAQQCTGRQCLARFAQKRGKARRLTPDYRRRRNRRTQSHAARLPHRRSCVNRHGYDYFGRYRHRRRRDDRRRQLGAATQTFGKWLSLCRLARQTSPPADRKRKRIFEIFFRALCAPVRPTQTVKIIFRRPYIP